MSAAMQPSTSPVLLYDGACGVCNKVVRAILRFDRHGTLRFAALDSAFARDVFSRHPELAGVDSSVFVSDPGGTSERVTARFAALLDVAGYLGGWWRLALITRIIPAAIGDRLYDRFAALRYRISGAHDTCPLPPPDVRRRFIDTPG